MSVSCGTGTAAVESEGAACRLEAVFLCGLHTFVHLWALVHVEPTTVPLQRSCAIEGGVGDVGDVHLGGDGGMERGDA